MAQKITNEIIYAKSLISSIFCTGDVKLYKAEAEIES